MSVSEWYRAAVVSRGIREIREGERGVYTWGMDMNSMEWKRLW